MTDRRVLVLWGGSVEERPYSRATGNWFAGLLGDSCVHVEVSCMASAYAMLNGSRNISGESFTHVANATHGGFGENGTLQGLLEAAGIPYTGSGVMASAIGMNKFLTKATVKAHDLPVAAGYVTTWGEFASSAASSEPLVVKPNLGGSSVGLMYVDGSSVIDRSILPEDTEVIVESFLSGRELTVGVFDREPLGVIEIDVPGHILDITNKYSQLRVTRPLDRIDPLARYASLLSVQVGEALGCRGAYRVDMRIDERGEPRVMEVNTQPGLHSASLFLEAARVSGWTEMYLLDRMLDDASLDR